MNENQEYGDIIQGDFIDTYRNLSNKGIMGFRWISENCRNAEIVLKIDDDAFINLFKLFEDLVQLKRRKKYIYCNRSPGNTNPIERDTRSKWSVHADQFRGFKSFPHMYCSGVAVFLSTDLIPALVQAAWSSPFFWIDDIYLFGILPSKVPGAVHGSFYKNFSYYYKEGLDCYMNKGSECHFLFVDAPFLKVDKLWEQVMEGRRKMNHL
ncbi:hypothetical protein FSP39_010813 [Pinctada imbricata]|uniref:Hexosyltransferase n=1 Tax=Pinctada imbricata TaxID=66713 RepID=A0AA88YTT7_PINIB|nr:hypothetical protein FSP39_010813 [Pinctada imbricata]